MAPPLIMIHAFPLTPAIFDDLRTHMTSPIFTPALPGFGIEPLLDEPPSMSSLADSILAFADSQGVDQFIGGGVSLGGYVVMELMRRAPQRLAGAILADTRASADSAQARTNRERIARLALQRGTEVLLDSMLLPLMGKTTKETKPQIVKRVAAIFREASPAAIAWTQRAMAARSDSSLEIRRFLAPVLVIMGAEDEISPLAEARAMAKSAPRGEISIIEGAGHLSPLEQPSACALLIENWLSRI